MFNYNEQHEKTNYTVKCLCLKPEEKFFINTITATSYCSVPNDTKGMNQLYQEMTRHVSRNQEKFGGLIFDIIKVTNEATGQVLYEEATVDHNIFGCEVITGKPKRNWSKHGSRK